MQYIKQKQYKLNFQIVTIQCVHRGCRDVSDYAMLSTPLLRLAKKPTQTQTCIAIKAHQLT